jgi:hypothetical protein
MKRKDEADGEGMESIGIKSEFCPTGGGNCVSIWKGQNGQMHFSESAM